MATQQPLSLSTSPGSLAEGRGPCQDQQWQGKGADAHPQRFPNEDGLGPRRVPSEGQMPFPTTSWERKARPQFPHQKVQLSKRTFYGPSLCRAPGSPASRRALKAPQDERVVEDAKQNPK